jgi:hypothetical protein
MSVHADLPSLSIARPDQDGELLLLILPPGITHIGVSDRHDGQRRHRWYPAPTGLLSLAGPARPRLPDGHWRHHLPDGITVSLHPHLPTDGQPAASVIVSLAAATADQLGRALLDPPEPPDGLLVELAATLVAAANATHQTDPADPAVPRC